MPVVFFPGMQEIQIMPGIKWQADNNYTGKKRSDSSSLCPSIPTRDMCVYACMLLLYDDLRLRNDSCQVIKVQTADVMIFRSEGGRQHLRGTDRQRYSKTNMPSPHSYPPPFFGGGGGEGGGEIKWQSTC